MLWFNNHSWDQENYYAEARQMMKEQRRKQRQKEAKNATDEDALWSVLTFVDAVVFFAILLTTWDLGLAFGVSVGLFVIEVSVSWVKDITKTDSKKNDQFKMTKK